MKKEYWDSCLFISYLNNLKDEKDIANIVDILIQKAQKSEILIVLSTLVLAEVRPRESYNEYHWDTVKDLFYTNRSYIRIIAVTPRISELSTRIAVDYPKLTVPDSIHVATAWSEKVSVMLTLDGDKDNVRRRSGDLLNYDGKIGNPPLNIKSPTIPIDSQLLLPKG